MPSFRKIIFNNFQNVQLFHFAQITLPNIRDKFKGILTHLKHDLTLFRRFHLCKSAHRIHISGAPRVIPLRTQHIRFQYNILISRSHPSLQHEGRTSIHLHVSSVRSARLPLLVCPASSHERNLRNCVPTKRAAPSCGSLSLSPACFAPCGIIESRPAQSVDSGYPLRLHSPTNLIERSHAYGYPRRNSRLSPPAA